MPTKKEQNEIDLCTFKTLYSDLLRSLSEYDKMVDQSRYPMFFGAASHILSAEKMLDTQFYCKEKILSERKQ